MPYRLAIVFLCIYFSKITAAQDHIIINAYLGVNRQLDTVDIKFAPVNVPGPLKWNVLTMIPKNNYVRFIIPTNTSILISGSVLPSIYPYNLAEPGDSITIHWSANGAIFSGNGAEKWTLQKKAHEELSQTPKPANPRAHITFNIEDYFQWNTYINRQIDIVEKMFDKIGRTLDTWAYNYLKANLLASIENSRLQKFWMLKSRYKEFGLTTENLCHIYDTTIQKSIHSWSDLLHHSLDDVIFLFNKTRADTYRQVYFDEAVLEKEEVRKYQYYQLAKQKYYGCAREKFLEYLITSQIIKELGFVKETEMILKNYYASESDPVFSKYVKEFEIEYRLRHMKVQVPTFEMYDNEHQIITDKSFPGKIKVLCVWNDWQQSEKVIKDLTKLRLFLDQNNKVEFLNVWLNSPSWSTTEFSSVSKIAGAGFQNLYPKDKNAAADIKRLFAIDQSRIFVIGGTGRAFLTLRPDSLDSTELLLLAIKKQQTLEANGPYIFYEGKKKLIYLGTQQNLNKRKDCFEVGTDQWRNSFSVCLKPLASEPSEFPTPSKMLVLSDIEGNFEAFRKLLVGNKVVDQNLQWSFGNGHLVINGDVFDRGQQVTECLWLIYSLEQQAKNMGGYVHFILGNHEIMNLCGDYRYVHPKYIESAKSIGKNYSDLFSPDTELGRWLRTKNICEKIGNVLVTHGGISEQVNQIDIQLYQINLLAKQALHNVVKNEVDSAVTAILFNTRTSPFWYRSYFLDSERKVYISGNQLDTVNKTDSLQIMQTLFKFNVNRIVTGHTIVADTVTLHYGTNVINVDTKHAAGKSEALLIEGANYFRVGVNGEKLFLFRDEKKPLAIRSRFDETVIK